MIAPVVPPDAIDLRGLILAMRYLDMKDEDTLRTIRCSRAWEESGETHITAWCLLREEPRRFKASGIVECIDCGTGEVISDPRSFFTELGVVETDETARRVWADIRPGVRFLMALASTDGQVVEDEIECVVRYADTRAADLGMALEYRDHQRIARVARRLRPDLDTAREDLFTLMQDSEHFRLMRRTVKSMVESDDAFSLEERGFLREIGLA